MKSPPFSKEELPTIAGDNYPARFTMDVYKSMQCFSDYTKTAVLDHNSQLAKKCFNLAGKLYRNGDNIVKNVIENTFRILLYLLHCPKTGSKN